MLVIMRAKKDGAHDRAHDRERIRRMSAGEEGKTALTPPLFATSYLCQPKPFRSEDQPNHLRCLHLKANQSVVILGQVKMAVFSDRNRKRNRNRSLSFHTACEYGRNLNNTFIYVILLVGNVMTASTNTMLGECLRTQASACTCPTHRPSHAGKSMQLSRMSSQAR